jgi:hypothetical protein
MKRMVLRPRTPSSSFCLSGSFAWVLYHGPFWFWQFAALSLLHYQGADP